MLKVDEVERYRWNDLQRLRDLLLTRGPKPHDLIAVKAVAAQWLAALDDFEREMEHGDS